MDHRLLAELTETRRFPDFRPGDTVRVHAKVIEGDRERIQVFEGDVIRIRNRGPGSTFTVRRVSHGIGVERIFPFQSPLIEKVDVVRVGRVRRAKLYYLRERVGKAARIRPGSRARFEELTANKRAAAPTPDLMEEEPEAALPEEQPQAPSPVVATQATSPEEPAEQTPEVVGEEKT